MCVRRVFGSVWQQSLWAAVAVSLLCCASADAWQSFPKSGRSKANVQRGNAGTRTGSANGNRGGQRSGVQRSGTQRSGGQRSGGQRSGGQGSRGNNGYRRGGVNRYYGIQGTGHRNSSSHFQGYYVPLSPYGRRNVYSTTLIGPSGFGYGSYRGGNFGYSPYGGINPAYSTYGSYLGPGVGVTVPYAVPQQPLGSSVAAEVLREHRLQQALGQDQQRNEILDELAAKQRELEELTLRVELEKAKLAAQGQVENQRVLKPNNDPAIQRLNEAAVVECLEIARDSQLKAERAFRAGNYGQAARFAGVACSLDEGNGLLSLFASQAHFANGEYTDAVIKLDAAVGALQPDDYGWIVSNFRLFYGENDYVAQTQQLSAHLKANPGDADAWLLRGYQYGALGYPDAAKKDLERAAGLGANPALVDTLSQRFMVAQ